MLDLTLIPPDGVWVPSPTFFLPSPTEGTYPDPIQPARIQRAVDVETQVAHSIFLARSGVTGIVLLGSTGEAIHLTRSERSALVSAVRRGLQDAGFPDYPLMAGVLTNGLEEALEWLDDYARAGVQWGLVLAPGYFGASVGQEGLVKWYTAVADRSPLPILVYNYPGVTNGVTVLPETYRVLADHPKIVGCKMSHGNVSHHIQVALDPAIHHDKFRVFSGLSSQLGPVVLFGAAGVIDGLPAIFPKTVVRLMQLAEKANTKGLKDEERTELQRLQYAVSLAEEFVMRYGIIGIKEAVYRVVGFGNLEGGRLPIPGELPEGAWDKVKMLFLQAIELTEASL